MISQFIGVADCKSRSGARNALRVSTLLLLCGLMGCAEAQLAHHSDALNRASAATMSEHVLLNAVRASLDLPMSFTKLTKYTTENMAKGSFAPKIPFGPGAIISNDVGPTANLSSGVSQVEYLDVNTAGALAKLNQSLSYDAIERYGRDGIRFELLFMIFVHEVELHVAMAEALDLQLKRKCPNPSEADKARCDEIIRTMKDCGKLWSSDRLYKLEGGHRFFVFQNRAPSACAFRQFHSLFLTLRLSGYAADYRRITTYERTTTPEQKHILLPQTTVSQAVIFREEEVRRTFEHYDEELRKLKRKDRSIDRSPVKLALRSPRSLLLYLGDLIALHNFAPERFLPKIVIPVEKGREHKWEKTVLFRVIRGHGNGTSAALSVRGPDGDMYFVPNPEFGTPERDQTLRVLAIAAELVNGAISEKDFPAPTTVTVRAIQ